MATLADLRATIDEIDQELVALIGRRAQVVQQIGTLKASEQEVVAQDRQEQVYASRRAWAAEAGADPDLVEALYRVMIAHFIQEQRMQLAGRQGIAQSAEDSPRQV
ncbi:MAG: chorismate mutase [Anaerolineae bacterium]|nr:chorismate mutase [Anaerolineae bacterium]